MLVCLCYGVSDGQIKQLVKDGVRTKELVQKCTKVGTSCGACLCQVEEIVQEACKAWQPGMQPQAQNKVLKSAG